MSADDESRIGQTRNGTGGSRPPAVGRRTQITPAPGVPQTNRTEIAPRPPAPTPARTEIAPPPGIPSTNRTEIAPEPGHSKLRTEITPVPGSTPTPVPAKPAAASLAGGTRIAQFEVIRELGRGGMGQVFLARDTKLGRLVALKFLGHRHAELSERFLVEARATARCQHENIVVIYEVDEWNGQPYMALEYLEGETLADVGSVSPHRAVELMLPVVRALVRAHEFNIVHRDLKPDNIFVQSDGVVKVLDFGIAKLFEGDTAAAALSPQQIAGLRVSNRTMEGGLVGTMPYMSPEQWGADSIDHRTDLWAVGIILWELLTGGHPLNPITPQRLQSAAALLDQPMPSISSALPDLPAGLERALDRCLAKRKADRFESAAELRDVLEALLPGRYGRRLDEGESPYPGMTAFQESDADRFFGRSRDVTYMVQKLSTEPMVGVVGPSGVGKSSFVRAGVVPALRATGDDWEVLICRPGRDPLGNLAAQLSQLMASSSTLAADIAEHERLVTRLRGEPGFLGTLLRQRARDKNSHVLLFVDQLEELYTLVHDPAERLAFTSSLAGVADDASSPLRVVASMRSDFLDRVAEDRILLDRLTRGLLFLPPVGRAGMHEALTGPLSMVNYQFESNAIVGDMLDELEGTAAALPLLQFVASKLWDSRDRQSRMLTVASYQALGGLSGALAGHADDVMTQLTAAQRRVARSVFLRLVTSESTRAIVDVEELCQLGDAGDVQRLINRLVGARLLAVQSRGEQDGAAVELVHESLITGWPTLRRWIDESSEDTAFLEQVRSAAKQWQTKGRPVGLLWRGEAMEEARRFQRRYGGDMSAAERTYLDAVAELATRSTRRRRAAVIAAFAVLLGLIAAAAVALVVIRDAKNEAEEEMKKARAAEVKAEQQRKEAVEAMQMQKQAEADRDRAKGVVELKQAEIDRGKQDLLLSYEDLQKAKNAAEDAQKRAEAARDLARKEAAKNKKLADTERKAREAQAKLTAIEREKRKKAESKLKGMTQGSLKR